MDALPADILTLIFSQSSLETLTALEQTCNSFRQLVTALDGSTIRDKVRKRVPWMTITKGPGRGLDSWRDCARLIVAKRRSITKKPKKWTPLNSKTYIKALKNNDIQYEQRLNVNGQSLPDSFQPMFDTYPILQPNGTIKGKYMEIDPEVVLDAMTFDSFGKVPVEDPMPKNWNGIIESSSKCEIKCPLSGIVVTSENSFRLWQESDRLLAITSGNRMYIVDKQLAKNGQLFFEEKIATLTLGLDDQLLLLPEDQGVLVFAFGQESVLGPDIVTLKHVDFNNSQTTLGSFPATKDDYECLFGPGQFPFSVYETPDTRLQTQRDFAVPFAGTLWVQFQEKALIPLWVDLGDEDMGPISVINNRTTIRLRPSGAGPLELEHKGSYRLGRSRGGRMVTHQSAYGRMVGDLANGMTYIVEDKGWNGLVGACFVGKDTFETEPWFFTIDRAWCASMGNCWHPGDQPYTKQRYIQDMRDDYECAGLSLGIPDTELGWGEVRVDDQNERNGVLNKVKRDRDDDGLGRSVLMMMMGNGL